MVNTNGLKIAESHSPESSPGSLRDLLCCLPRIDAPGNLSYQNIFRVLIMQFIDAFDFDVARSKRAASTSSIPPTIA